MKIVVPVDADKQTVTKRTGQAAYFAVYEDIDFVKLVPNAHGGDHLHHHGMGKETHVQTHRKDVVNLQGCDVILLRAVGEHMKEALESVGLKVKKIRQKDGKTVQEVVNNFVNSNI